MATLDNKKRVDDLISKGGHYRDEEEGYDEPPVLKIVRYTTQEGRTSYGLIYPGDPPDYYKPSLYVFNPETIFEHPKNCGQCQQS